MKDLYKTPEILVEELTETDVLCLSDVGGNKTEKGMSLLNSIAEDFFG